MRLMRAITWAKGLRYIVLKDDVKESEHIGLEIVVNDNVKDEDNVDYTRLFITDKVCICLVHNIICDVVFNNLCIVIRFFVWFAEISIPA
jgi:hypothetical protein